MSDPTPLIDEENAPQPWRMAVEPVDDADALEAMLFAAGEPVRRARLLQAFGVWLGLDAVGGVVSADPDSDADADTGEDEATDASGDGTREASIEVSVSGTSTPTAHTALKARLDAAIEALRRRYDGRGVELVETAGGLWFRTPARCADAVRALLPERPPRPSRALLETLAVIAYRQPVTRGEIEAVRGVAVSASVVRSLLDREWIRVIGHQETPGRPALLATTQRFLDDLGLKRLDDLPPLEELRTRGTDALDRAEVSDAALRRRAQTEMASESAQSPDQGATRDVS